MFNRLLDAFFILKTREMLGRILSNWVGMVDVRCRRCHIRDIVRLRAIRRFGSTVLGSWLQHTKWEKSGDNRLHTSCTLDWQPEL